MSKKTGLYLAGFYLKSPKNIESDDWIVRGRLANARRRQEAEERISSAIKQLQMDGLEVTVRAVREEAGAGSFSTICRVLKEQQRSAESDAK